MARIYTHRVGEVVEVTPLTKPQIHRTPFDGIKVDPKHFCRCRAKWDDGQTNYYDAASTYSPGDRIAVISYNGKVVADLNIVTRQVIYSGDVPTGGVLGWILYRLCGWSLVLGFFPAAIAGISLAGGPNTPT